LKTSSDPLHAQEKEHDFLLDALGESRFDAKSDRLLEKAEGRGIKQVCSHMFEGVKRVDGCRYPPEYEDPTSARKRHSPDSC